jgi:hypothetical protein
LSLGSCPSGSSDDARQPRIVTTNGGEDGRQRRRGTGAQVAKPVPKSARCRDGERRPTGVRAGRFVRSGGKGIPAMARVDWAEERRQRGLGREQGAGMRGRWRER